MRVGRSALGVFASNLFNLVLSFGNSILLTRTLGVVGRGEFAVFSASFGILSLLMGLGLDVSLRYFVAKEEVPRERILSTLMVFAGLSGVLLLAVVHANHALFQNEIFLPSTRQGVRFELTLVGVVVANMIYGNIASVFAGSRSFKTLNVASVGFSAVSLALYGALLWAKASGRWTVDSGDVFVAYLALQLFNADGPGGVGLPTVGGAAVSAACSMRALLRGMLRIRGARLRGESRPVPQLPGGHLDRAALYRVGGLGPVRPGGEPGDDAVASPPGHVHRPAAGDGGRGGRSGLPRGCQVGATLPGRHGGRRRSAGSVGTVVDYPAVWR